MKVTISYEFDTITESEDLIAWVNTTLAGGEPVKKKKSRKPRKPMTDEEKAVFRARMVKGQEAAKARKFGFTGDDIKIEKTEEVEDKVAKAEALGEELAKGSKSVDTKKSASKSKPEAKKKATK